ncbi:MAG: transcriptional repressor [Acidimicrobiia bacterium]|nr:transcriptional repressor [Acidimicrobiia bacterium]
MSDAAAEAILDRLRASGGRITSARRALVNALFEHGGHPTAEDLAAMVQVQHPDVAQSTIYRILDDLEQLGEVHHTHLGHGPAVYHLAATAHPHIVCEDCGLVTELDRNTFNTLARRLAATQGFVVSAGHFAVTGQCQQCASRDVDPA